MLMPVCLVPVHPCITTVTGVLIFNLISFFGQGSVGPRHLCSSLLRECRFTVPNTVLVS